MLNVTNHLCHRHFDFLDALLQKLAGSPGIGARRISLEAQRMLMSYHWPGNVRELENVIQRSAIVAQGETILLKDLPQEILTSPAENIGKAKQPASATPGYAGELSVGAAPPNLEPPPTSGIMQNPEPLRVVIGGAVPVTSMSLEETFDLVYERIRENEDCSILMPIEREIILRALRETGGNQVKASRLLGMARVTLRKRINEHQLRY